MAITSSFKSLALYPGGQGLCGIVFTDPEITLTNTLRSVTVDWEDVKPLIWNMKEWVASASMAASFDFDSGASTATTNVSASGKLTYASIGVEDFGSPTFQTRDSFSTGLEPSEQICGAEERRAIYVEDGITITDATTTENRARILPRFDLSFKSSFSPLTYSDAVGVAGNADYNYEIAFSASTLDFPEAILRINVLKIWVVGDGTCVVYFDFFVTWGDLSLVFIRNSPSTGTAGGSVTGTFLGASFSSDIYVNGGATAEAITVSYDITVSESWTY
jgi:hypothetical protein